MLRLAVLSFAVLFCAGATCLAAPAPQAPKIPKELLEERVKAARDAYEMIVDRMKADPNGAAGFRELPQWSRRWLEAEKALSDKKEDRLKALTAHWRRMKEVERIALQLVRVGAGFQGDARAATYYRAEAEIWLLQAGGEVPKADKAPADNEGLLKPRPKKKVEEEEGDQPRPKRVKIRVEEEEPAPKKKPPAKKPS
jgi:hypothetical protein